MLAGRRILLIIGGGIAAYKSLELIRLLQKAGAAVRAGADRRRRRVRDAADRLGAGRRAGPPALFDLTAEAEMGHIELSRSADLVVVAPATADLIAKLADGLADDLASTLLLATDKRVLLAPAMNVRMWQHPATRRNLATAHGRRRAHRRPRRGRDGLRRVRPRPHGRAAGDPRGHRRRRWPAAPLAGRHVLVTSGPTHEPIDPVRYIANRSSGRQGSAIAAGARAPRRARHLRHRPGRGAAPGRRDRGRGRDRGARCSPRSRRRCRPTPPSSPPRSPTGASASAGGSKVKKDPSGGPPALALVENPDILRTVAGRGDGRPALVVGFAAETDDVVANATAKRLRKGADWIVANDVSPATGIMGGTENAVTLITAAGAEPWPRMSKDATAEALAERIAAALA